MFAVPFFQGLIPRRGKRLVAPMVGRIVENVDLDSRALNAYPKPLQYVDPTKVGVLEAIYRFGPILGGDRDGPIEGYTQANPVVVTSTNHNLETGDVIFISGINVPEGAEPIPPPGGGPPTSPWPGIMDIGGDDIVVDQEALVIINGFNFGATQGNGFVEFGLWPTYYAPDKEIQTINSWTDTVITLTSVDFSTWSLPATLYVWITPGI